MPICQAQQTAATGASSKSHPPKTEQLWLEAESGKISLPLRLGKDEAASGGQHIYMPAGKATYAFTIAKPGTYRVWGRVLATGGADNSFFISMDGGEKFKWNHNALKSTWQWEAVKNDKLKEVAQFKLAAGNHTLTVGYHEDGSRFDQLLITDDLQLNPAAQATSAATTLYLEAENGNVTPPMQVEEQAAASGGKYVWIPDQFSTYEFRYPSRARTKYGGGCWRRMDTLILFW